MVDIGANCFGDSLEYLVYRALRQAPEKIICGYFQQPDHLRLLTACPCGTYNYKESSAGNRENLNTGDCNVNLYKSIYIVLAIAVALAAGFPACSKPADQGINYDPAKNYAAFLVPNTDSGKASLEAMKKQFASEGLEIGPVEYYTTGTKDFGPALTKLTASKQVTVVCINFSSITDISNIKQSMGKIEYKGSFRYTTDKTKLVQ